MSDIKGELTGLLDKAKVRYEDARKEVELLDALIAEFQRLTAGDTRAFPAVPPRSAPVQTVPDRSAEPQGVGFWAALVGKDVTLTYTDGRTDTGRLAHIAADHLVIETGDPDDAFAPALSYIASVVPAPPAAATVTDPPADETPKDGA